MAKNAKKVSVTLRERKANAFPYLSVPLSERLKKSGNINLEDNFKIIDMGNGYWEVAPLNDKRDDE